MNHSHPAELISVITFDNLERIAARARAVLATNHAALNEILGPRGEIQMVRPGMGTTVFPKLLAGNADAFDQFLRNRYETGVVPGRYFEMPEHFRIGLGGDPAMTRVGLERLSDALGAFRSTRSYSG